jgi:oligopeptide transport system ATP-binding protein
VKALLEVENLKKHFPLQNGIVRKQSDVFKAVDGLSFTVHEGETLGLVGESGCGKSTTGRMLLRLIDSTEGTIRFKNQDIGTLSKRKMRKLRGEMQMVFQDPFASLNPRNNVEKILEEPLIVHGIGTSKERKKKVKEMLNIVGLSSYHAKRYPHQFSGGQRQRIGIARALMTKPQLIIADEPVSALDVSIQSQVLNLMKDLQKEFQLTYIFIAHDLGVVRQISDRVAVMYKGKIVELANSKELYENPVHPYTQSLLSAVPVPDPDYYSSQSPIIKESQGTLPEGYEIDESWAEDSGSRPALQEVEHEHFVACSPVNTTVPS